jgi:hypothetical protein
MTPNDYYIEISGELGDLDVHFDEKEILEKCNLAYQFLVPLLNLNVKKVGVNAPLVPYVAVKAVLTDFYAPKLIYDPNTLKVLDFITFKELEELWPEWDTKTGECPKKFALLGTDILCMAPVYSVLPAKQLTMIYSAYPPAFETETTVKIPDHGKFLLIYLACALIFANDLQFGRAINMFNKFSELIDTSYSVIRRGDNFDTYLRMVSNV